MPIFSKGYRTILFAHIPKVAGSTVESVFLRSGYAMQYHDHKPKVGIRSDVKSLGFYLGLKIPKFGIDYAISRAWHERGTLNHVRRCSPQHMHYDMLDAIFDLDKFDINFAIVRNPISRFRSEFAMRHSNKDVSQIIARDLEDWFDRMSDQYLSNQYILDNHLRPQSEFIGPKTRVFKLEDGLKTILYELDSSSNLGLRLVKVERLLESSKTKIGNSARLPLSTRLIDKLKAFYERDFDSFGYD